MEKIKIITDSNAGITIQEGNVMGISVIPMPFYISGEEYFEELTLSQEKFYEILESGEADIHTSQPSPFYLEELWENIFNEGYDKIIYIPMSAGLSGTCETAKGLAQKYDGRVFVVDNRRISVTQKESVFEALSLIKQGKTAEEIYTYLEETGRPSSIYIMLETLEYLKRGGRITPTAAAVGNMLHLKPVLFSDGDSFDKFAMPLSVVQAKKKMIAAITKDLQGKFKEAYDNGKVVASIAHTQNKANALKFKDEIMQEFPNLTFHFVDPLSLSVSCHIGPGALAIALCVNNNL